LRVEDRLRRTGRHHHLAFHVETRVVKRRNFIDHGGAKLGHASHRHILVTPGLHVAVHGIEQRRLGLKAGKALREVHRSALRRHLRHRGENGSHHVREAGIDADRCWHGPVSVDSEKGGKIMRHASRAGNRPTKNGVVLHSL
jgi:hypothetical protein